MVPFARARALVAVPTRPADPAPATAVPAVAVPPEDVAPPMASPTSTLAVAVAAAVLLPVLPVLPCRLPADVVRGAGGSGVVGTGSAVVAAATAGVLEEMPSTPGAAEAVVEAGGRVACTVASATDADAAVLVAAVLAALVVAATAVAVAVPDVDVDMDVAGVGTTAAAVATATAVAASAVAVAVAVAVAAVAVVAVAVAAVAVAHTGVVREHTASTSPCTYPAVAFPGACSRTTSGSIFRVGIVLDFVWLTTRTMHPHGACARGARRNRN